MNILKIDDPQSFIVLGRYLIENCKHSARVDEITQAVVAYGGSLYSICLSHPQRVPDEDYPYLLSITQAVDGRPVPPPMDFRQLVADSFFSAWRPWEPLQELCTKAFYFFGHP